MDKFKKSYSNDNGKFFILVKRNGNDFSYSNDNRNTREKGNHFLKKGKKKER